MTTTLFLGSKFQASKSLQLKKLKPGNDWRYYLKEGPWIIRVQYSLLSLQMKTKSLALTTL